MRIKTLVLVMIALVSGLLATIGISQVIDRQGQATVKQEMAKIFIASTDLNIGDAITPQNVRLEEWPKDRVPEGALSKLEELDNRFASQRFYKGEPIMAAKLMDNNTDAAQTIPDGFRAHAIKVSGEVVVGNLVKPGDRVDVLVFLRKNGDVPITGTRTILRDTRVFAVNTKTERSADDQGQVTTAQTVTLLVTPKQVEMLALASQLGSLRLSLRRPNDSHDEETGGMTVEDFLQETESVAMGDGEVTSTPEPADTDSLMNLLQQIPQNTQPEPEPETPAIPVVAAPEPAQQVKFSMVVHTPNGLTRYDWTDEKQMPQATPLTGEVAPDTTGYDAPAAAPATEPSAAPTKTSSWLDDTEGTSINVP